jgi:hypothetical protein
MPRESTFLPRRVVDVRTQLAHMRARWPQFNCRLRGALLVCRGRVRPTLLCATYDVRIEHRNGSYPRLFIEAPALQPRDAEGRVPHTYAANEPCAFHPPTEWKQEYLLALTVLPWLYRWLFVYENWRVTGVWDAYGIHPAPRPKRVSERAP